MPQSEMRTARGRDKDRQLAEMQARLEALEAELTEAREQQTATAEVLAVINSSPGDLAPVFDAILEKAHALCGAALGSFCLNDGERMPAVATRGYPEEHAVLAAQGLPTKGAFGERLARGEIIHLDLALEAGPTPDRIANATRRTAVEITGSRTYLAVPLRKDGALLGYFSAHRREVRPFTEKEIALLENFAAQAVIAMENARLLTETREALEQQTATAEVLEVINSSPGDLAPVFDAMLEKAMDLCGAAFGMLQRYDGERFEATALRGLPPAYAEFLRNDAPKSGPGTAPARIVAGEEVVHVHDLKAEDAYRDGDPRRRAMVDLGGARSSIVVALRKDGELLGSISAYRQEVRPFTEKQIALLQNFAAQAVIAMENARLVAETREALEQQTATAEVLQVINSSPGDLAPVFEAMLDRATRLCEAVYGVLWTYDGEFFRAAAGRGVPQALINFLQEPQKPEPDTGIGRILAGEQFVVFRDLSEYRGVSPVPRAFADLGGGRTGVIVGLRQDAALLGAISIFRQEVRPFTDKQIALLQNFAAQAVIAIENARLITETREALEQQTATAEVLQVINSSPGDLAPVFDAILEKAHRICSLTSGSLVTYDGSNFTNVARRGVGEQVAAVMSQARSVPWTAQRALLRGDRLVHIPDLLAYSWDPDDTVIRPYIEASNLRAGLLVPLRKDGVLLGYISGYRDEAGPFSEKEIALLESFAAQAVIAMENARLLGELRERTSDLEESLEYQTATSDVLKVISRSTGDVQPVLDTMVETAVRLCGSDTGAIWIREGEVYRYMSFSAVKTEPEYHAALRQRTIVPGRDTSIAARVALEGRVVHVEDIRADPDYALPGTVASGRRTMLGVPLLRDSEPIGVIALSRKRVQPFTERQIELVRTFADQAVIAMENARLLGELHQRTDQVAELNRGLEARVAEQVEELGRVGRLKRFLAPQLAEMIVSQGDEKILESHRREIVVVFCDLRGYTAFTETAEPEEVLGFLREYHGALGPLVSQFEGTLDQFSGDGIMVFFNDPVPIPDPAERAVKMAIAMREAAGKLITTWRRRGRLLGFGAGIAQGYATLGQIGFAERSGYTAIGTVCNLAARLCAEAKDGQILVAQRVAVAVEAVTALEEVGELNLKGLTQPVVAFNVPLVAAQPALRVIEGRPEGV